MELLPDGQTCEASQCLESHQLPADLKRPREEKGNVESGKEASFVFGQWGGKALALKAGIPWHVVLGISSAIAVARNILASQ